MQDREILNLLSSLTKTVNSLSEQVDTVRKGLEMTIDKVDEHSSAIIDLFDIQNDIMTIISEMNQQ